MESNSFICVLILKLTLQQSILYPNLHHQESMLPLLLSRVRLCVTPKMAVHQASPSLGFSRQEHWSGLPFPSPKHESEKWKWSHSVVSNSQQPPGLQPPGLQPTRLLRPWDSPGKSTGVGCHCLLRGKYEWQSKKCVTSDFSQVYYNYICMWTLLLDRVVQMRNYN